MVAEFGCIDLANRQAPLMPRSPRIEYADAVYHVLCRGDQREPIFHTDADRELFLAEIRALPRNDLQKQGLAWLLRTATVVTSDWVSAKLCLGHRSNVSRAVQRIKASRGKAAAMRATLQPCTD